MNEFVIHCKSYLPDIKRVRRLHESILHYNTDSIPFYLSVPKSDMRKFKEELSSENIILVSDDDILSMNKLHTKLIGGSFDGGIIQQVIKSEFWRLGKCNDYLVIDSDSYFIKEFFIKDFYYNEDNPLTIMHNGNELLQFAARKKRKVINYFRGDREASKGQLGRTGIVYDFGPTPCIWSKKVWLSLEGNYLSENKTSFFDLIQACPNEMLIYGESLLKYKAIDLWPREPIFKCFHYQEQYEEFLLLNDNIDNLKNVFMGVVMQSNWDEEYDLYKRKKRTWKSLWLKH